MDTSLLGLNKTISSLFLFLYLIGKNPHHNKINTISTRTTNNEQRTAFIVEMSLIRKDEKMILFVHGDDEEMI